MTVAVVYHFLPHYRSGIFTKLLTSTKFNYIFVGGTNNMGTSIPLWVPEDLARFVEANCHFIRGPWYYQSGLAKLALRRDISAIIYLGTPYSISTWYSAILARMMGKEVLFWTHGWLTTHSWFRDAVKRQFMRLADILLLYGEGARAIGLQMGFSANRMLVIYNSLDYAMQKKIRESIADEELILIRTQLFGNSNTPYAICTARLTQSCEFDLLLSAQAILRKAGRIVNILLVGDGPERERLTTLARSQDLPVVFFGACYDETTLAKLIRAAHVTVSPGKIGLTAIHSLAYGTPVITHNDMSRQGPEAEAIIPNFNGGLFRRGDAGDLAEMMWEWCSRPWPDVELRLRCYEQVEMHYNPVFQMRIIESALSV